MEACLYKVFGKTEQEIRISSLIQSMQTQVGKITDDRCFGLMYQTEKSSPNVMVLSWVSNIKLHRARQSANLL